jgi:hypothetical protein
MERSPERHRGLRMADSGRGSRKDADIRTLVGRDTKMEPVLILVAQGRAGSSEDFQDHSTGEQCEDTKH